MVPRSGRWRTTFKHKSHRYCLGTFSTAEEAARVWDLAAIKSRAPNFTGLNFPRESYVLEMDLLDKHTLEETLHMLKVKLIDAKRSGRAVKRKLDNALAEEKMGLAPEGPVSPAQHRGTPLPVPPVRKGSIAPSPLLQKPDTSNPFSRPALVAKRSLRSSDAIHILSSSAPRSDHEHSFGSAPSALTLPEAMGLHTRFCPRSASGLTSFQPQAHSQCTSPTTSHSQQPKGSAAHGQHLSASLDGRLVSCWEVEQGGAALSPTRSLDLPRHSLRSWHVNAAEASNSSACPGSPACWTAPRKHGLLDFDRNSTFEAPASAFGSPRSGPLLSFPALHSARSTRVAASTEAERAEESGEVVTTLRRSWSEDAAPATALVPQAVSKGLDLHIPSEDESSGVLIDGARGPWGGMEWAQEALVDTTTDAGLEQNAECCVRSPSEQGGLVLRVWEQDSLKSDVQGTAIDSTEVELVPSTEQVRACLLQALYYSLMVHSDLSALLFPRFCAHVHAETLFIYLCYHHIFTHLL
jgi:hypothetical protein